MEFQLLTDAKTIIIKHLNQMGLKPVGQTYAEVFRSYFNLKHKLVSQQPRQLFISSQIASKVQSLKLEPVMQVIQRRFTEGGNINPFLSKGIFRLDEHDYLLNDWGIHHLHLNNKKTRPSDYFHQRSDHLLFVHVTETTAYLIDIRPHNENYVFAQRDLLRVVRDNWPDLNRKFLVKEEPMEIHPKFNEQEIAIMRKKGYMFFTQVDEYAYMPVLGSSCSGFSLKAGMEMYQFQRDLYKIHCYTRDNEEDLKQQLSKTVGVPLKQLHITLVFKNWMFYVYEMNSQQFVNLELTNYQPPYPAVE